MYVHTGRRGATDGHAPYDENAMLFMDYRTDYVQAEELTVQEARDLVNIPTFLYAMPLGKAANGRSKIFFEEVCVHELYVRMDVRMDVCICV